MFYFRINKLKIFNNREGRFLGVFGRDLGEVKILSFVTTGNMDLPSLDELVTTNDEARKREIVKVAVAKVAASRDLTTIENVKDSHIMTFGDTGYVLFQSDKIPDDFNWTFIALETDRDVRSIGEQIESVVNDPGFDPFAKNLATLIVGAANPVFTAGIEISKFITQIVSRAMKKNKDDMIGILYMSLNKREHYPHGERKKDDVADLTNNMLIDYSIFGFDPTT